MAAFLDHNPTPPEASTLPDPVFPPALAEARSNTLSAIEIFSAVQVLASIPQVAMARQDQQLMMAHIAHLAITSMRRSAAAVGSGLRTVRRNQLVGESRATRDALVHQPIMFGQLYTDPSLIGTNVYDGPAPTRYGHALAVAPRQQSPASVPLAPARSLAIHQVHPRAVSSAQRNVDVAAVAAEDSQPLDLSRGLPRHPH